MAHRKRRIWLPWVRLGAFVAAVALTGHFALIGLHDPTHDPAFRTRREDLDRMTRSVRKKVKIGHPFLFPASAPRPDPVPPVRESVETTGHAAPEAPAKTVEGEPVSNQRFDPPLAAYLAPDSQEELLGYLAIEPPVFLDRSERPDLYELLSREQPKMTLDIFPHASVLNWMEESEISTVEEIGNTLFSLPESFLDGVVGTLGSFGEESREGVIRLEDLDDHSLTSRLLDIEQTRPRLRRPFMTFFKQFIKEEYDYFGGFNASVAATPAFQQGYDEADLEEMERDQTKVLLDTVKATYVSKYRIKGDETIRSHRMYFSRWKGVDFVVMPTLLSGYAYYRGLEKRIRIGDTRLILHLEPLHELTSAMSKDRTSEALVGMELRAFEFPVYLLASAGVYDGALEVDFVGIGTSYRQVRRALKLRAETQVE